MHLTLTYHPGHRLHRHGTPALRLLQFTGTNGADVARFCGWQLYPPSWNQPRDHLELPGGGILCRIGDYLVQHGTGPITIAPPVHHHARAQSSSCAPPC